MKEKKARLRRRLHASRAAVEEGIVARGVVYPPRAALDKIKGENPDQDAASRSSGEPWKSHCA